MATYSTNEFKLGLKVMLNSDPCSIIENEFVKPGKGQAFNRVKFRNLKTGRVLEKTYKSGELLPGADVIELEMQYLYNDIEMWYFMDQNSFEQYAADDNAVADAKQWIKGEEMCVVHALEQCAFIRVGTELCHPRNYRHRSECSRRYVAGRHKACHYRNRRCGKGTVVCRKR